jgi:DNA mismatch endonuclease, patch repair protein
MTDTLSPQERSKRMGLVKGRDTGPEMLVRRLVHRLGYRYRLHRRDLPGCPDLVFPGRRKIIFVHGCFWHRHPSPDCKLARLPKSRQEFWIPKLNANRTRDLAAQVRLLDMGWQIMLVWECETNDPGLECRIKEFLDDSHARD